jgi:demethylmenaquinone methyltransferase/2-methoxy-6-polyprenyl-1,4-benzoquinol methylase
MNNLPDSGVRPEPPLKGMFDAVPRRYDLLNRVLTLGRDERWRRRAARRCLEGSPKRVLDICCGTGDLTRQLARRAENATDIVGLDYSVEMLDLARVKLAALRSGRHVRFVEGDAAALEFPDGYFDAVGIAFAFRNLTWRNPLRERALGEILRVLRPGGRFVIVETSQPASRILRAGFHAYLKTIAGPMGTVLSRHPSAYRYLAESARKFFGPDEVKDMLRGAGFEIVRVESLLGGAAAVHVVRKPEKSPRC